MKTLFPWYLLGADGKLKYLPRTEIPNDKIMEDENDVCEFCGGDGFITEGEYDDVHERKCICKIEEEQEWAAEDARQSL